MDARDIGLGQNSSTNDLLEYRLQCLSLYVNSIAIVCAGTNIRLGCHVMEKESFCSTEVAGLLNSFFIPIKLDRESRPDIDEIYMSFITATTGSGGWPLNIFLTPDLQPVFGGTYWPGPASSTSLQNTAAIEEEPPTTFVDILQKMKEVWTEEKERCIENGIDATDKLKRFAAEGVHSFDGSSSQASEPEELDLDPLDEALNHYIRRYDSQYGGFTSTPGAPKFPTPINLTYLLRIGASITHPSTHTRFGFPSPVPGIIGRESCLKAAGMALHTLLAMSRSALRDHLAHGFHRYSVTPDWNLPHFEKMLYDNAQLLSAYSDAWALGRDPEILGTIYSLVEYFTSSDSRIRSPTGLWYSSEDADSIPNFSETAPTEKKEGAFYVWSYKRFVDLLGDRDGSVVAAHYGVKADGNVPAELDMHDEFLNQNVLHIAATPRELSKQFNLPEADMIKILKAGKATLASWRSAHRIPPDVDNKIILSWNALAITALARAANTLTTIDATRSKRCIDAAVTALTFIEQNMYDSTTGRLTRIFFANKPDTATPAFLEDYAYLIVSLLAVYDITFVPSYLTWAQKLQEYIDEHFGSTTGAYFQAEASPEQLFRLKPGTDNSLPSPNGVIANNLFYMSAYVPSRHDEYVSKARNILNAFSVEIIQYPYLYVGMLSAIVMEQTGVKQLQVPETMSDIEINRHKGFGRTVVKEKVSKVMICLDEGLCRELKEGELEDHDDEDGKT